MAKKYCMVKRTTRQKKISLFVSGVVVAGLLLNTGCSNEGAEPGGVGDSGLKSNIPSYAVSSSNEEATLAAEAVLKAGGNAVDAAVTMAYTLAVTEPYASGLGGGGCMVVYDPESEAYYYYNYSAESARSGVESQILVPGFVSGMEAVMDDFGTLEYREVLEPAISYCDGVTVTASLETRINNVAEKLGEDSVFFKDGQWLEEGDVLVQPELKETLQLLAAEGPDCFYHGQIAADLVNETPLTAEDLAAYETICTQPVKGSYQEYEIVAADMPYSGTTLVQMLKMAEMIEIPDPKSDNQGFLDGLLQITTLSHAERAKTVYDYKAAGETVNSETLVSDAHVQELLGVDLSEYEMETESEDTTAFTVIDDAGMVVVCTNTLSSFFGSKKEVDGIYLNNTARNFGSGVNGYEPGKRPRSFVAPAILRSENETIAIASPGGDVIVKVLATTLMDICQFDTDPQVAVDKQRVLFEGKETLTYEIGYDTDTVADVFDTGYTAIPNSSHSYFGAIALSGCSKEDGYYTVTDQRRNGHSVSN